MPDWQFYILICLILVLAVLLIAAFRIVLKKQRRSAELMLEDIYKHDMEAEDRIYDMFAELQDGIAKQIELLRINMGESVLVRVDMLGKQINERQTMMGENLSIKQDALQAQVCSRLDGIAASFTAGTVQNEERFKSFESFCIEQFKLLSSIVDSNLKSIQENNNKRLDEMRGIIDEKLQRTLDQRITESFRLVNERLTEVYRGLGEMKSLATGVGDLKKVLSNVKTRGTLGEIQLGAILDEILAPEQFVRNFDAKKKNNERVEFAVKLPNEGGEPVYLPIDSKFPADVYTQLIEAYDSADTATVAQAQKRLRDTLIACAKSIRDKYIAPPTTTDFAIMFLPTEGLYAEAVKLNLIELLQRDYRVNLSGPSTMAALLNSLQMGFRTLAIQKRSNEVWGTLAKIKKEFQSFEDILLSTQKALDKANTDLDKLIGVRTRQIIRTLKDVESLPSASTPPIDELYYAIDESDDNSI